MNKKMLRLLLLLSVLNPISIHGGGFIGKIIKQLGPKTEGIVFGIVGKAEKQLTELKQEKENLKDTEKTFTEDTNKKLAEIIAERSRVNALTRRQPANQDFLSRKLAILNETYQEIKDLQALRAKLISLLDDHINLLDGYIKDTEFKEYIKEYREQKRFYTFNDLQNLHEMIISQGNRIKSLGEQLKNSQIELENREHTAETTNEEYLKIKKSREDFTKDPEKTVLEEYFAFDKDQKLELLTLDEDLYKYKNKLDTFKLKEVQYKQDLLENKKLIAGLKLNIIKKVVKDIKPTIRITEADIAKDRTAIETEKRQAFLDQQRFRQLNIDPKIKKYNSEKPNLITLSEKFKIPLNIELDKWEFDPRTAKEYMTTLQVGQLNENLQLLAREKDLLEAQMNKNEEQLNQKALNIDAKETFYKIIARKFATEEDINKEKRKYNSANSAIKAKIANFNEKRNSAQDQIEIKNKALENIRELREKLRQEQSALFRNNPPVARTCFNYLKNSEEVIKKQIATIKNTTSIYDNIISLNENVGKQIDFVISELETLGMFYRPEYAIKWEDIKNIIPSTRRFISDIASYLFQFRFGTLVEKIKMAFPTGTDLLMFIIKLLFILLLLLLFRIYAPLFYKKLISISEKQENKSAKFVILLVAFALEFIVKYFILISIWVLIFSSITLVIIPDPYIIILFYLLSIPYLIYLTNRLLKHFVEFNKKNNLLFFIAPSYQNRLLFLIGMVIYSTIAIQLFRKAFMLEMYLPSELPSVLSVLNGIIIQIAIIMLITKEIIIKIIPKNWNWSRSKVNKFYYIVLLVAGIIIIMANPNIGFGRLLLYVIQRLLLSILLIVGLVMLHNLVKRISLRVFFVTEEEIVKARFNYGKIIYGLYVIFTFLLIVLIGVILASQIWSHALSAIFGKTITTKSIYGLVSQTLFTADGQKVTIVSFIKILVFIISGFIFSFLITKYILRRLFDLLLVESGIQYAISSILRYIIISTFLVIGFNSVGLGKSITYILLSILALGWLVKEPITDFLYYFLILIQRPLKIGDYIRLQDGRQGVVRKITPRAVILKFRNSETILVPNSKVMSDLIINWNYISGFVAFDDMMITIPYKYNPAQVKDIFLKVLDGHPNILKSPKPVIRLNNFGEYGYEFLIRGFVSSHYTLDMWDIASDVRIGIVQALRENNIKIAVPVRLMKTTKETSETVSESGERSKAQEVQEEQSIEKE